VLVGLSVATEFHNESNSNIAGNKSERRLELAELEAVIAPDQAESLTAEAYEVEV
jgi:hypothetical protein